MAMSNVTKKSIPLQFWTCFFLDSEDGNYATIKPNLVLNCRSQGKFLVGGSDPSGYSYYGHAICIFLCVLIYLIGIFGFVTNVLNVLVLRKTLKGSSVSLKFLLVMLAIFELFACIFTVTFATVIIVILENANRGEIAFHMLHYSHILYSYGRTGAIYITILVTIERYLVVAFPIKSKAWLTPSKSKLYVVIALIITFFLDLPWVFNSTVVKNTYVNLSPYTSVANFPYIMNGTAFGRYVYPQIRIPQLIMNYVAPFPLLLIFNGLLYLSIHNWNKNRQALTTKQRSEINAARMFSVVVLILLSCHTVSCILVVFAQYAKVVHRELMLLQLLSVTLSAAVNFLVYMGFGRAFKEELRRVLLTAGGMLIGRKLVKNAGESGPPGTQTSADGDSSHEVVERSRR